MFWLFIGGLGLIGGWWFILSMGFKALGIDIYFFLDSYSFLNLILALITMVTLWTALILGGPYIINDAIRIYRSEEGNK